MSRQDDRTLHLVLFLVSAPSAAIVWFVFHAVYQDLTASVKAVGYVDASTQIGIDLGYFVMVVGTLVLATVAIWQGIAYLRIVLRDR
ncbi:MAG: hypothetical protein WB810_00100 [Candidatus Cybelea sp.]